MPPEIAVVVPSRRGARLAFLLEALSEQTLARDCFEVIIVRDASSKSSVVPPSDLPVRFLQVSGECGPTVKRNAGWRSARSPFVAFTDDDCRPQPAWLATILAALKKRPDALVQGVTRPDPEESHLLHGLARSQSVDCPSVWFQCANLACSRATLDRLDGFDEDFYFGGEDTDFGARAVGSGAAHLFEPGAVVDHAVIPRGLAGALREAARWPSLPLLLRKHPAYRDHLYKRFFWQESHALVLLAALGAFASTQHRAGVCLALPYVAYNIDPSALTGRGMARQLAGMPSRALVDAIEVGATIRSAIRFRVPVA